MDTGGSGRRKGVLSDDFRESFPRCRRSRRLHLHASLIRPSKVQTYADWLRRALTGALMAQPTSGCRYASVADEIPAWDSLPERLSAQVAPAESLVLRESGL
jgi:hypothetical protein